MMRVMGRSISRSGGVASIASHLAAGGAYSSEALFNADAVDWIQRRAASDGHESGREANIKRRLFAASQDFSCFR